MKRLLLLLCLLLPASSCVTSPGGGGQVTVAQFRPVFLTALQRLVLSGDLDAAYYDLLVALFDSLFLPAAPPAAPTPPAR